MLYNFDNSKDKVDDVKKKLTISSKEGFEILEIKGMTHLYSGSENGLDTVIGTKGAKLSGGQMQRIEAARMFVRNPEILVFDDISSALDVETETLLWTRLFNNDKATCIVVSNRRIILEKADNIIVLKNGVIEAQGTLEKLLKSSIELKEIVG